MSGPSISQVILGWKYGDSIEEKAKTHPMLRSYKSLTEKVYNRTFSLSSMMHFIHTGVYVCMFMPLCFLYQEKEIYRFPVKESLKSMLAMGWNIDRTKEGETMFQQRESEKMRKISQVSQVYIYKIKVSGIHF